MISFTAAISARAKGGQWRRVAPLFVWLLCGLLSLREGWAVAACGAIVRCVAPVVACCLLCSASAQRS
eukprot:9190846-Karenia_brevis.AAC.1